MDTPDEDDTPPSGPSIDLQESNILLITIHKNYGTNKYFLQKLTHMIFSNNPRNNGPNGYVIIQLIEERTLGNSYYK